MNEIECENGERAERAERFLHSIIRSGMLDSMALNGAVEHQSVKGAIQLSLSMAAQFEVALERQVEQARKSTR